MKMHNSGFKKNLVIGIICMFLLTSITSIGVMADNQQAQNSNKISEETVEQLFTFIDTIENIEIDSTFKNIVIQKVLSNDDEPYFPGLYFFIPCDSIDIDGKGLISEVEDELFVYLHVGTVALNNTYNGDFKEWEIMCVCIFINFTGEWSGTSGLLNPLEVTGSAENALLFEWSFLLEMTSNRERHERGVDIPLIITRFDFIFMVPGTINVVNPHFYIYYYPEDDIPYMINDILIQETWEITRFGSKTWNWNQKDYFGEQVPDGDYSFSAEFEYNGRMHPLYYESMIEIVEELSRNINNPKIRFYRIFERFPNAFPLLRHILGL